MITGGDLLAKDGRHGVVMHLRSPSGDRPSVNPRIISATDSRIHCAWPEELSGVKKESCFENYNKSCFDFTEKIFIFPLAGEENFWYDIVVKEK